MKFEFLDNVHKAYSDAVAMFFTLYTLADEVYEDWRELDTRDDQLFPAEAEDAEIDRYDIETSYKEYASLLQAYAKSIELLEKTLWEFNAETVLENHMAHEVEFMKHTYQPF